MNYNLVDIYWAYGEDGKLQMYIHNLERNRIKNILTDFVYSKGYDDQDNSAFSKEFNSKCLSWLTTREAIDKFRSAFRTTFASTLEEYEKEYSEFLKERNKEYKRQKKELRKEKRRFGTTFSDENNIFDPPGPSTDIHRLVDLTVDENQLYRLYTELQKAIYENLENLKSNPRYF